MIHPQNPHSLASNQDAGEQGAYQKLLTRQIIELKQMESMYAMSRIIHKTLLYIVRSPQYPKNKIKTIN